LNAGWDRLESLEVAAGQLGLASAQVGRRDDQPLRVGQVLSTPDRERGDGEWLLRGDPPAPRDVTAAGSAVRLERV